MSLAPTSRHDLLRRGLAIEASLIGWNVVEGAIAVSAGLVASSVALIGFGVDSLIELTSGAVVTWRLWLEYRGAPSDRVEQVERRAARIAGAILLLLAAYIVIDSGRRLWGSGPEAEESLVGIVLTGVSLVIMPALAWVRRSEPTRSRLSPVSGSRCPRSSGFRRTRRSAGPGPTRSPHSSSSRSSCVRVWKGFAAVPVALADLRAQRS